MLEFGEYLNLDIRILLYIRNNGTLENYNRKIAEKLNIPIMTVHDSLSRLQENGFLLRSEMKKKICYELTTDGVSEVEKFLNSLSEAYEKLIKGK